MEPESDASLSESIPTRELGRSWNQVRYLGATSSNLAKRAE